ncbi:hypothetical protein [Alteromonas sp. H39]|uniref:hypothetical protein n=1 Tax=Alteromonas sp. H39 TaxID=3389876 RepID=UPI0039E1263E
MKGIFIIQTRSFTSFSVNAAQQVALTMFTDSVFTALTADRRPTLLSSSVPSHRLFLLFVGRADANLLAEARPSHGIWDYLIVGSPF